MPPGGGIYCTESPATLSNNTIVGNSATDGGGVYCDGVALPTITNSIVWGNGDDLFGCDATYSCPVAQASSL